MKAKILVVEDDETLQETLVWNLERQGYKVTAAGNGRTALNLARDKKPDLIILDVMLPGLDGIDVCRILRKESATPILMLTARTEEVDKIVGLEIGADDYMTKPFSMRELLVRVKALLRRVDMIREEMGRETAVSPPPSSLTFGSLTIDEERREVRLDNQIVKLQPKEFELLLFLARHQGVALSRSLILEKVWGWTFDGNSRTVDVHVRWLREKIEADPAQPQRIVTVRGIGYRFD
ncbi:MAG TPA: response regulator transcription factor [Anaerolineae bacterium]|nr:response regulator transcription factor [Anaerolineae bacterium]